MVRNSNNEELNIYRSGSAPPSVEGSLSAIGGLFDHSSGGDGGEVYAASEEQLRADPSYIDYYYNNVKMNPRLPPPLLLSKEDWRFAQRGQRGDGNMSLFSVQPGFGGNEGNGMKGGGVEWGGDELIGMSGLGIGSRQKSFAEIIQEDMAHATSAPRNLSRTASRSAFDGNVENVEGQFAHLSNELTSVGTLHSSSNKISISAVQNNGSSAPHTYASALSASLSRSSTPDPQLIARAPSPRIPLAGEGRVNSMEKRSMAGLNSFNGVASNMSLSADMVAAMSNLSLSSNGMADGKNQLRSQMRHEIDDLHNFFSVDCDQHQMIQQAYLNNSESGLFQTPVVSSANPYMKGPSTASLEEHSPFHYLNMDGNNSSNFNQGISGYPANPASQSKVRSQLQNGNLPHFFDNPVASPAIRMAGTDSQTMEGLGLGPNMMAAATELQNLARAGSYATGNGLQAPPMDPLHLQYLMSNDLSSAQMGALGPKSSRGCMSNSHMELLGLQKAYLGNLISQQKSQRRAPYLGRYGNLNHGYYENRNVDPSMLYPGSPLGGPLLPNSNIGLGSPIRHSERNMHFNSMRNAANGVLGPWHSEVGVTMGETFESSLLDEFKSNKTKCFKLSEIVGHVVEFSADQYGSRFIQQKLETATADEKNMVFHEIMPQALALMTDVFGNYVIQKFFEHGTGSQIKDLADKLSGHVLSLSLQMYGCRVIQKAIEVVKLDQQTNMVKELDGNVMRCVRDQNGNHVIQKCIECIPEEAIQFIVSTFYDQVVMLSTHPYGCRVIQRVLEHCHDPHTQCIMMDRIMQSICMLAQDQYGNYVVQHVLEHGKPHERSAIIKKLTGQIVQMSQQKFASNVIEKCLTFGTPEERQALVTEMLGSTDENEPLQAMMKDQFANYVVQKVLETCDDHQLELILNRIKVHLNALKKYTYGKHIVARVEKLVAAGGLFCGYVNSEVLMLTFLHPICDKHKCAICSEQTNKGELASRLVIPRKDGMGSEVVQLTTATLEAIPRIRVAAAQIVNELNASGEDIMTVQECKNEELADL